MIRSNRKIKIVATLGPASSSSEMIGELIDAGVDIFRLNFSHGDHGQKRDLVRHIRTVSGTKGKQVGILADLQGPKIRTGKMAGDAMQLDKGQEVVICTENILGRDGVIPTIYRELPDDVNPGSRILMDDGLLELRVLSVTEGKVRCQVVTGGVLKNNKGINLPGVNVSAPSLTEKDKEDLDFALDEGVDFVALSFVRTAEDVEQIKRIIYLKGKDTPVVAKIEKPEALRNFKKIIKATDAIMVARGDLGVEVPAEKVPIYQKQIISECNRLGKPVITATQMLESMVQNPRPTRAETSDVANAIIDGTDAVMLSAETASGQYPVQAVATMARIALDVEKADFFKRWDKRRSAATPSISQAVAEAACYTAHTLNARAIAVFTQSGSTAALISRFRPNVPIIAFTESQKIQRRLTIHFGVTATDVSLLESMEHQIKEVEDLLLVMGYRKGDIIVIVLGLPVEARGSTNVIKVHKLGTGGFFEIY